MNMLKKQRLIISLLALIFSIQGFHVIAEPLNFNPNQLAEAEVLTWKAYYQKDKEAIIVDITRMIRLQYDIPYKDLWLNIAPHLLYAVINFKNMPLDSSNEQYNTRVLPSLTSAYSALKKAVNANWDPQLAAQNDLEWWIYRRNKETSNPEIVGKKISELYSILYGNKDGDHFLKAGYLRAVAARYHDLCDNVWKNIHQTDWIIMQKILEASYLELSLGIKANEFNPK